MKDKKHIDKLFQERFQNFEATPPPETWLNIRAKLEEKKEDRKIIPLWWKVGGVAALLALLLTIGNSVFNSGEVSNEITEENKTMPVDTDPDNSLPIITEQDRDDSRVATEDHTESKNAKDSEIKDVPYNEVKDPALQSKDAVKSAVANQNSRKGTTNDKVLRKEDKQITPSPVTKEAVAGTRPDTKNLNRQPDAETGQRDPLLKDAKIVSPSDKEAVAVQVEANKDAKEKDRDPLIKDKVETVAKTTQEAVVKTEKEVQQEKAAAEDNKKSIFDAIDEAKTEEAIVKNTAPDKRWEVSPNVGPVYYSSFGSGSSIDPVFADNSQSGDVNFSYGAAVSYVISEKLSVRTGLNNVNLSYSTAGVELGTGPVSSALKSIDYGGRQNVITAVDKGTFQNNNNNPDGGPFSNLTPKAAGEDAFINQSISYYEVPMELKYALINNKFGINMIGGFSTLFLGNNEVSVNAGDFSTVLGPANNLNSLSFTTNIGVGFDYKISKRLKFNIEPMFKYQLNPYSDTSVDFNPFYMGVYTGLSFKF